MELGTRVSWSVEVSSSHALSWLCGHNRDLYQTTVCKIVTTPDGNDEVENRLKY